MDSTNEDKLRAQLREHLARELHDAVAGQLQAMLVEMELLRRSGDAPGEIETFQSTTRQALGSLREMLYQLRDRPAPAEGIRDQVDRRVSAALTQPAKGARGPGPAEA
ncbi:MAG: histidine kinase dimerization/phosphoacceptor domain-containing protein [bacterium]|jgi:signal transduction histidine kinase|nr:histidine kinase dimerization/phosphoacceptor domain-containing protein [bacterium]